MSNTYVPVRGTTLFIARDGIPVYSDFQPDVDGDNVPPKMYYVLGTDYLYRVDSIPGFADAITHVNKPEAVLPLPSKVDEVCRFRGPKLPYSEYLITVAWYRVVMKKHSNSEALLVYHINSATGLPMAVSPSKYEISQGRVRYKPEDFVCERCRIMATIADKDIAEDGSTHLCCPICWNNDESSEWNLQHANLVRVKYWGGSHSHNTMGAFASGTDIENEKTLPGVHLIFGHLDHQVPDLYAALIVAQSRFELKGGAIAQVVEFPDERAEYPARWEQCVVPARTQVVVSGPIGPRSHLAQWHDKPTKGVAPIEAPTEAPASSEQKSEASKMEILNDFDRWGRVITKRIGDTIRGWDEPNKTGGIAVVTQPIGGGGSGGNGVSGR